MPYPNPQCLSLPLTFTRYWGQIARLFHSIEQVTLALPLPLPLTLPLALTLTLPLALPRDRAGRHALPPAGPSISLYLPTSPHISLHLPISPQDVTRFRLWVRRSWREKAEAEQAGI